MRAYEKRYGVDRASAVQELQRLGRVNPQDAKNMLDQLKRSERRKRRSKSSEKADPRGVYGVDFDDHHAFIAGRTEAGFAFGVTWEERERLDALEAELPVLSKPPSPERRRDGESTSSLDLDDDVPF